MSAATFFGWVLAIIGFGYLGHVLHKYDIGPLRLVSRLIDYARAVGYLSEKIWTAAEWEVRTQWECCVEKARMER